MQVDHTTLLLNHLKPANNRTCEKLAVSIYTCIAQYNSVKLCLIVQQAYLSLGTSNSSPSLNHLTGYLVGFFTLHEKMAVSCSLCFRASSCFWMTTSAVNKITYNISTQKKWSKPYGIYMYMYMLVFIIIYLRAT